jgi:hypothetical protein
MKIDPNGRIPPSGMMTSGSMNHFFSGIGLKMRNQNVKAFSQQQKNN